MNFYEKELRAMFERDQTIKDKQFAGRILLGSLGDKLLEKAREDYSIENTVRRQLDIYETILRRRARAARRRDGVILCGCHPGDCHYTTGNYYARRRMTLLFSMLDYLGIERERTRVEWVSAAEGAKFAATMNEFVETVTRLGENKRLEDLRCKSE